MDPDDGPTARVERTFWAVWYYITGAVNRFFTNNASNDPNSIQESAVDSETANIGHSDGDSSGRGVDEEQSPATASLVSSSRPLVAWELCTTDIDLVSDEETMQYTTQPSRGSDREAFEEGEVTEEEQFTQAGTDDAELLVPQEDKQKENGDWKLYTGGRDEVPENAEHVERANTGSLRFTGDAMGEDMDESGRKAGAEEASERAMALEDDENMDVTIQQKEEDAKMQHEDEQDLEADDIEVNLCTITNLSLEEEDNMHSEEAKVQRNEADTAVMYEEVENGDGVLQLASENENKSDEAAKHVENQLSVCEELSEDDRGFRGGPGFESGIVSEDELIVEQEHVTAHRKESDKVEDAKEEEDESALDKREQGAVTEEENVNEAANNQTTDEAREQEDDIKTATEDSQEEDIEDTEHVTCSKEVVQNAKTELRTEDVAKDAEVQTKRREIDDVETESHGTVINEKSDVTTTHISVDEIFFDKEQVGKQRLSSEEGNKESYMEIACTTASVTVKPEGETGQEMSGDFKNIPLAVCEGRVVVAQELNSPTCEETQEGVPEYNNEPGPDENTTQRFLEEGDCTEIQGSQLPEEVESKEPESLQNSSFSTGADYVLGREHMDESTRDIKNCFDAGLPHKTEKPLVEAVIQESGHLFEEEEGEFLVDLMKTGIEHSEKEFESDIGLTGETDKATKEPQDGTVELLVEFEIDEELCDSKVPDAAGDGSKMTGAVTAEEVVGFAEETFLEAEVQKITETSLFQESVDAINSGQNDNVTASLLDDIPESGFLKQSDETEPQSLEDVEMQDAGIDMEETGCGVEEEGAEDEMQNKVAGMAESELSRLVETLEMKNQPSDEALEMSNEEMLTELKTAESKPKDLTLIATEQVSKHVTEPAGSYAGETFRSISGHQDVIDEEILDLWIQTALSEDTDAAEQQEGPELGQQMEPSNEEQDEISSVQTKKDKEQLVESNSRESELVSDTEMSSSTVESGFLDQSLSECSTQNRETQLLKSASTGSLQGIFDMLANTSESADISELSTQQPNSNSQDILMEEEAETRQSYLREEESNTETGVISTEAGHLNQESDESREKTDEERDESAETEAGSQKDVVAEVTDTEEADAKPLTEVSAPLKVEKTKAEHEPREITASDSPDEIKHTETGRSRSSSEASLEEEIVLTESASQDDTCTESKRKLSSLPAWSEDVAAPGLNWAEQVAEQQTAKCEDQMEMDISVLDFTVQRSRIAVKNPRVRPPKDPRSLLHMPSVDPTPSSHVSVKIPAGVPLGGLGIGIKLPGLGVGFPVLKKTQQVVRDENSPHTLSQETTPEEKSDAPKQDEAQHQPKWMPPRHPGFGNPLMSELKTKLKKTTKE